MEQKQNTIQENAIFLNTIQQNTMEQEAMEDISKLATTQHDTQNDIDSKITKLTGETMETSLTYIFLDEFENLQCHSETCHRK